MPKGKSGLGAGAPSWFPDHGNAIAKMSTKSVMSPLLWGVGVLVTSLLVAVCLTDGETQKILVWLVVAVVAFFLFSFAYFAVRDPDRLQSEEYVVERERIALLRESGKEPKTIDLRAEQMPNVEIEGDKVGEADGR